MARRVLFTLVLASALALVLPAVAMANFAIHGNYLDDTDACAGCHRAHTSVSTITWTNTDNVQRSALLATSATRMIDFCYACHDATSQGADTNVQEGIYEGTDYGTQDALMNGGAFETDGTTGMPVTSTHIADGASWGAYGGGYWGQGDTGADGEPGNVDPHDPDAVNNAGETIPIVMDCATCHDPHGSPNYRILKSEVFGNPVGGYIPSSDPTDPNPDGWVASTEEGWPVGGFRLHTEYPNYKPNYTEARYAKGYDMAAGNTLNASKGMSGWCSGCHTTYNDETTVYNAGDGFNLATRHKHPVNVPLANYKGPDAVNLLTRKALITSDTAGPEYLPLAHDLAEGGAATPSQDTSDWVECLTCHRAHGTAAQMEGWANEKADDENDDIPSFIARSGSSQPSALLRLDNRGVCEVCHNK